MDITPLTNTLVQLLALVILSIGTAFIGWAANMLHTKWGLDISNSKVAAFDDQLDKAITFGVTQFEAEIKAKGWDDPTVKDKVLGLALSSIVTKAPGILNNMGLSTDLTDDKNRDIIMTALMRALPASFAKAAASPATPPATTAPLAAPPVVPAA